MKDTTLPSILRTLLSDGAGMSIMAIADFFKPNIALLICSVFPKDPFRSTMFYIESFWNKNCLFSIVESVIMFSEIKINRQCRP